jgi:hypothetical protein
LEEWEKRKGKEKMKRVSQIVVALSFAILCCGTLFASPINLITNGDFSGGLSDWSETNSCCYYVDGSGFREGAVNSNGMLSQTFTDTPGAILTVSFNYLGEDTSSYQYLSFDNPGADNVAGSYVAGITTYLPYQLTLGVATGLDTITFDGQNNPSYNTLDNVVVTETTVTPEPSSLFLLGTGLVGVLGAIRRKLA